MIAALSDTTVLSNFAHAERPDLLELHVELPGGGGPRSRVA